MSRSGHHSWSALAPRRTPRQARSQATVEVVLEAAVRVLARDSLAGFNTNRVAEVAGISIGSLYQYFPSKAALVAALIGRTQLALLENLRAVLKQSLPSLHSHICGLVAVAVEHQFSQAGLAAALDHEESRLAADPLIAQTLGATRECMVELVLTVLQRHADELSAPLTAQTAEDVLCIAKSLIETEAARREIPSAELSARVERAVMGYLCC